MLNEKSTLRVAVVEAESETRKVLESALGRHPNLEMVGAFANAAAALQSIPMLQPDAVLLHIEPGIGPDTINLSLGLRQALPKLGVVLVSEHRIASAISFLPKQEMPGWGYIYKDTVTELEALKRFLQAAADGGVMIDPNIVLPIEDAPPGLSRLTARQQLTLQLLAEGLTNRAIAEKMDISVKAVENHINQIYQEFNIDRSDKTIHPRIRAVKFYFAEHLFNPDNKM